MTSMADTGLEVGGVDVAAGQHDHVVLRGLHARRVAV
jgi:hypothetical protein